MWFLTQSTGSVPTSHCVTDDENSKNPSFITSSLPRQPKPLKAHRSPTSAKRIGGDNYVHVDVDRRASDGYFLDSSSESESDSGRPNDAYLDDASSTLSDELFKSTSEGQANDIGKRSSCLCTPVSRSLCFQCCGLVSFQRRICRTYSHCLSYWMSATTNRDDRRLAAFSNRNTATTHVTMCTAPPRNITRR